MHHAPYMHRTRKPANETNIKAKELDKVGGKSPLLSKKPTAGQGLCAQPRLGLAKISITRI